jgi:small nuclear ribonucleoprotein (snRNP)-like protein
MSAGEARSTIPYWQTLTYGQVVKFKTGNSEYIGSFNQKDGDNNLVFNRVTNTKTGETKVRLFVPIISFEPVTNGGRRSKKTKKSKRSHKRRKSVRK